MKAICRSIMILGLGNRIVTLPAWLLVDEITAHFLQSFGILYLLEAHWRLSLGVQPTQIEHILVACLKASPSPKGVRLI